MVVIVDIFILYFMVTCGLMDMYSQFIASHKSFFIIVIDVEEIFMLLYVLLLDQIELFMGSIIILFDGLSECMEEES